MMVSLSLQHYVPNLALEILHYNAKADRQQIKLHGFLVGETLCLE